MRGTGLVGRGRLFLTSSAARRSGGRLQQRGQRTAAAARTPPPAAPGGPGGAGAASGAAAGGAAGGSAAGSRFSWMKWALLPPAAAGLLGGVAHAFSSAAEWQDLRQVLEQSRSTHKPVDWLTDIEEQPGAIKVMTAEMLLEEDHKFLEDDHMFAAFVSKGIVNDITGYYSPVDKKFFAVVSLGREVCGFPKIVHGGLTAAIIDESFGGLLFALKEQGAFPFWGPAYTVHLEVGYKHKIQAGRTVLCTTEVESVEGRKLWMKATVSDGPNGIVYATARALFVAPKPHKMVSDVGKYLLRRLVGDW
eukprot:scaffold23.g4170.t1